MDSRANVCNEGEQPEHDNPDEDSSAEDTEEEIEPELRYERLKNDVPKILQKDAASCIAVHTKFLALGTHLGIIYILDHQGNNIPNKELVLHVTTVNHISIDERGDYIASCSNDGKVVIHGMYSSDLNTSIAIERPVRCIALDPDFSKYVGNRRFIIGEDKVVFYERHTIFSRYKSNAIYQGEGPIRNIKWQGRFVAWASDKTVRIYDLDARKAISVIMRDFDPSLRADLYRCNMFWKSDQTLLIGWANSVKVCNIVTADLQHAPLSVREQPYPSRFYVEITSMFNTDFYICGISALDNAVVVFTISKNSEDGNNANSRPQLRVLEPESEKYVPISCDILKLYGYEQYRCNDYHLESLSEEGLFFIICLKDFVVAKRKDEDDHIVWLLKHNRYKEALDAVLKGKKLRRHTLLGVGHLYLDHLLKTKQYDSAAQLCPVIFGTNKQLWEEEIYKFAQKSQLRSIAPYLPVEESLDPTIYEMVLNEFLQNDPEGFLDLIRKWPPELYNIPTIVSAVMDRLTIKPCLKLLESLSELYIYEKKYDKALTVYIEIKNKDLVFELIKNHNLFGSIHDRLEELIELNPIVATNMLLDNIKKVPVELVVTKLKHKQNLLYQYLHRVFLKDPSLCEEHHGLLMELYAEHAPEQLLFFLRTSNNYALEHALDTCEQYGLIHEVIFLLGRMGNTKQALQQITQKLQDINQAIQFCKEHDDKELWEDLIQCSLDKPGFITVLLQNIGTHVDPIMLIQKIPNGMKIPGLRDSLVKILQDYNLQISLREGCKKILVADCYNLLERLNKQQKRGILISDDQVCQACHRKLLANDSRFASDIIVFNCRHAFHEDCFPFQKPETCSFCSAQKRGPGTSSLIK